MVFHLRQGVKWHNKPPLNGREFVAEDVKFTYDRFLTEKANANRFLLEPVDPGGGGGPLYGEVPPQRAVVWLVDTLAYPWSTWIMAPEVAQQYGDFKKPETVIGTGPFILERYEPNVKAVFKRNPNTRQGQPHIDGVEWLIVPGIHRPGHVPHRPGRRGAATNHAVRQQDLDSVNRVIPT